MLQKHIITGIAFAALLAAWTLGPAGLALAQDGWMEFSAKHGFYKVRMPNESKTVRHGLRIDPQSVVYSEEISAVIDQRPYKNVLKSYIVKYDQTLGLEIGEEEGVALIHRTMDTYGEHYSSLNGTLKKRAMLEDDVWGFPAGEIFITYDDPVFGLQGVRSRIFYTRSGKFEQIVMGPDTSAYSLEAENFFESMRAYAGIVNSVGALEEKWVKHVSPMMIYTIAVPPLTPVYMPQEPVSQSNDSAEVTKVVFTDPARGQNLFYNVYGYRLDEPLAMADAEKIFFTRHLAKYIKNPAGVKYSKDQQDKTVVFTLDTGINPPKNFPYVRHIRLKMQYLGNYAVVQEMLGDQPLTKSTFANNLMSQFFFHPLQAHKFYREKLKAASAVPTPATPEVAAPTAPDVKKPAVEKPPAESAPPAATKTEP